jgi:hypothetical protein
VDNCFTSSPLNVEASEDNKKQNDLFVIMLSKIDLRGIGWGGMDWVNLA